MQKIEETDKKLFGDYAVIVSGFNKEEQTKLLELIKKSFNELKIIFVNNKLQDSTLEEIFAKEHEYGFLDTLYKEKAIIMSGFLEKELIRFMRTVKAEGITPKLWATLTPTSNKWIFRNLIEELDQEAKEIRKMRKINRES